MNINEFENTLVSDKVYSVLENLAKDGTIGTLFPELQTVIDFKEDPGKYHKFFVWEHTLGVVAGVPPTKELGWAALFHDVAKPCCWSKKDGRVHFLQHDIIGAKIWRSAAQRNGIDESIVSKVYQLIFEHQNLKNSMGEKGLRRVIFRLGDNLDNLFKLTAADILAHADYVAEQGIVELEQLKSRVEKVYESGGVTDKLPEDIENNLKEIYKDKPERLDLIMTRFKKMLIDGTANKDTDFVKISKGFR